MADEKKKIIVDDDWKEEARREKEQLSADTTQQAPAPSASFIELLNLLVMQAMAGLGLVQGPGGEAIPPNIEAAKHFIDMLQVLEDKTKGNLSDDESKVLDQVLYEMRMRYVQVSTGGGEAPPAPMPPK